MSKKKVSIEDKMYAVNLYLAGKESQHRIASMWRLKRNEGNRVGG